MLSLREELIALVNSESIEVNQLCLDVCDAISLDYKREKDNDKVRIPS